MEVLTLAAVLSLISVVATEPQTCKDIVEPVSINKTQITGKWIFIEGTADSERYISILKTVNSSRVDIVKQDDGTFIMKQRNMLNGECSYSACGMNFFNNVFIVSLETATSTCAVLPSSPDSLVLSFISLDSGEIVRSLYAFGRTKTMSESDLQMYHKQLECLTLPLPSFKYDGKSDICPDQEKPAEEGQNGLNH